MIQKRSNLFKYICLKYLLILLAFLITVFIPADYSYSQPTNTCGCTDPGGLSCTIPSPPCPSATVCHNPTQDPSTIAINLNALGSSGHFESCSWVEDGSGTPPDGQTGSDGICDLMVVNRDDAMGHDMDFLGECEVVTECEVDGDCDDANACTVNRCIEGTCDYSQLEPEGTSCGEDTMCTEFMCSSTGECVESPIFPPPQGCPVIGPEPIPTLSEWGLIFLVAFLFMAAIWRMKKYRENH